MQYIVLLFSVVCYFMYISVAECNFFQYVVSFLFTAVCYVIYHYEAVGIFCAVLCFIVI